MTQRPGRLAWSVLLGGLVLTIAAFTGLREQMHSAFEHRLQVQALETRNAIDARLRAYGDVLLGLAAFFQGSTTVSQADFQRYCRSLDLPVNYPGVRLLNFVEAVPRARRDAFLASVRADTSLQPQGRPEFRLHPEAEREVYFVTRYVEPPAGNSHFLGYDQAATDVRRLAMEQARDSGTLATSGALQPVADPAGTVGFQLRMPVYRTGLPVATVAQRREAFLGVVGAGLRMKELMAAVLQPGALDGLHLRIHDSGPRASPWPPAPDNLLWDSADGAPPVMAPGLEAVHNLELGGRRWTLVMHPTPAFLTAARADRMLPWTVLAAGTAMSLLLAALVHALATAHGRALRIARDMTRELRHSEAELAETQRVARLGSWRLAPATGFVASPQAQALLGAQGLQALRASDRHVFEQRLAHALLDGEGFEMALRLERGPGAAPGWLQAVAWAERDGAGVITALRGTLMDVSGRKRDEARLAVEHAATRLLAESDTTAQAVHEVLGTWCRTLEWQAGAFWRWDGHGLRREQQWPADAATAHDGDTPSEWVQRAWTGRAPAHATPAAGAPGGLRGALAVPVAAGGATLGVLELRRTHPGAPDVGLVALATTLGTQLAQHLQRRRAEDELLHAAHHDVLTGLLNRGLFLAQLEHAIERGRRLGTRLAVCFIDLDRFKAVNDTLGHAAGDALLREVAARLQGSLRRADLVARHGGDEFVVLAEEGAAEPLDALARKLVAALGSPYLVQGQECPVTASVGVAVFPQDGQDAATLLRHADVAMYRAKQAGKNRHAFYSAQMDAHARRQLALQAALRRAVERRELTLAYQPKIDLLSGRVTGVEALARWRHAELGAVGPDEFIPLAEELGLIGELGGWVLGQALADAAAWRAQGLGAIAVAVNLSASQFADEALPVLVRQALADSGTGPGLLELEITESMVMREPEQATAALQALREAGVRVSIDDFGTGHSSLAYLKRLPLDAVKLDRSFVRDLPDDTDDAAITAGVIALAHRLRLRVVAEGVENAAQAAFLREVGCDQAQGWHYSRALPAPELAAWLRSYRAHLVPADDGAMAV